ncbi:FkbM family methyltransferase [Emticicia sp. CRIBPO]|uniref:FkbM family methyltransferase n=1 Tax=Emticicia sp. CRIBPO TaxID=2683258 RepID=UPI001412D01F|nr:FkbM family methyltransferase [Emticicia sp. CRIBPO]
MFSKFKYYLRRNGINIQKRPAGVFRPAALLEKYEINLLLDIGANVGDYANTIRSLGYNGDIYSFEPLKDAFEKLKKRSGHDDQWKVFNIAIGDFDGKSEINVASNSESSSILDMSPNHLKSAPQSVYTRREEIIIKKLDTLFEEKVLDIQRNIFLKVDTQGFEKRVLEGGLNSMSSIKGIQLEMSLIELYEDEPLMVEMINYLSDLGYRLCFLEPVFSDPNTSQLLQVDGVFYK